MKTPIRLSTLLLLLIAAMLFASIGLADAGNFSGSSDYGGGFDFGSSDWGSSDSGWDWGSSDSDDSDWGSSSAASGIFLPSNNGGGGGDDDGEMGLGSIVIAAIIIVAILLKGRAGKKRKGTPRPAGAAPTPQSSLRPISEYPALDPGFRESDLTEQVSNLYVRLQNAWEAKQFEPMRPHMTDALYNQFARQLDEYVRAGRTNHIEKIAVLGVQFMGFMQDAQNDSIVVRLRTRIIDYDTDDKTGEVLSGSRSTELFMEYEWTLTRACGIVTDTQSEMKKSFCPNCGAPIELNQSAKCAYCGSILTSAAQEWAISGIKGISRRSA